MPTYPWYFGSYEVRALLGSGVSANVYRAFDLRRHQEIALKVIHAHLVQDPQIVERFYREAQTIRQLNHPHIIKLSDFGQHQGQLFIAMPFIANGTLTRWIQEGRGQEWRRFVDMFAMIAEGLFHAHNAGVIHRDIKPANILLDENDAPIITDFGVARVLDQAGLTVAGRMIGNLEYSAPEQLDGSYPIGIYTDIYALGVVLYEAAAGILPFDLAAPVQRAYTNPAPPRQHNRALPESLERVILRCLERDPAHRFATSRELGMALQAAVPPILNAGETSSVILPRERNVAVLMGVVLVSIVTLSAIFLGLNQLAEGTEAERGVAVVASPVGLATEAIQGVAATDVVAEATALLPTVDVSKSESVLQITPDNSGIATTNTPIPPPTATSTPVPVATKTPTFTPSPTETATIAPTATRRVPVAPILLSPEANSVVSGNRVIFEWQWEGTLNSDESFDVLVWRGNEAHNGVVSLTRNLRSEPWDSRRKDNETYYWSVAIVRLTARGTYEKLVESSPLTIIINNQ